MQSVADVEPGPLQDACPNTGTLGRAEVSVVGVPMEMIVEHGHNDTAFGSNACCPRPSNSFPPSQVDSFCALSVLVCVTWRVDRKNAQPTVFTSVRLSVAGNARWPFLETPSAREGAVIESFKAAHQLDGRQLSKETSSNR